MRVSKQLEVRLQGWSHEYAGGRYENVGWPGQSWLATAMKYRGRAPQGLSAQVVLLGTEADEVEQAVAALERMKDGFKPGRVLRCEYAMQQAPEELKLQHLRRIGLPMSRQGYYGYLKCALIHVGAWLRVPASDERDAA